MGLSKEYMDKESETGKYLRYCFGLPFLEPGEIGECFAIDFAEIQPQDERVTKFADFLVENYIAEDALFPPCIWAENSSSLSRTTNACESFHAHFSKHFYTSHPNIFIFVSALKDFQKHVYIKIRSISNVRKQYSLATRNTQKFLEKKLYDLKNNVIGNLEFVKSICYRFQPL